jgi:short-subunit dehydrogenase
MAHLNLYNNWVLVTGASSGLGAEMAMQLARDYGANLVLMARREDKLTSLKSQLEKDFGVQCKVITADLSKRANYADVFNSLSELDIHAAVLNAGITYFDEDMGYDWQDFQNMLDTNVSSVVYFTRAFCKYFDATNKEGSVLVVGSVAGLVPVPYQASYSSTKAFLVNYCQAIQQELSRKPYSVSLFAPGGIDTDMNRDSGLAITFSDGMFLQSVESCAEDAIETMIRRKNLFVPRLSNRLQVLLVKLLPRSITNRFTAATYRKALKNKQAV